MIFNIAIAWPGLKGVIEILVIAIALYYILSIFQGTRGAQVLTGLVLVIAALLISTRVFQLDTLTWILQRLSVYLMVALLIIFQPEIRRALAELGRQHLFPVKGDHSAVDVIVRSALSLAERKIGALIAIERQVGISPIRETGTTVDSVMTPELITSIFYPRGPLHDGGLVVRGDRIAAAGCFFPLTQREGISKALGTRHRAALGLTEETDAVVVVVSEETGAISLAYRGKLRGSLDEDRLRRILGAILKGRTRGSDRPTAARRIWASIRTALNRPRMVSATEARDHAA